MNKLSFVLLEKLPNIKVSKIYFSALYRYCISAVSVRMVMLNLTAINDK